MQFFIIVAIIIAISVSAASKKKQQAEAERKRREANAMHSAQSTQNSTAASQSVSRPHAAQPTVHTPKPHTTLKPRNVAAAAPFGSLGNATTPEGEAPHVVKSSFEQNHSHMETSMTGDAKCESTPDNDSYEAQTATVLPSFTSDDVVRGFIFSEILGKPKSVR